MHLSGRGFILSLTSLCLLMKLMTANKALAIERLVRHSRAEIKEMSVDAPWFCHGLGCPRYKVKELNETKDYEVRQYVATQWVSSHVEGANYDKAVSTMFRRLFKYIGGENEKKEKIEMTCPVLVRVIPGQGPTCASNFTESFFVSPEAGNPPAPTSKEVFFSSLPAQTVYVRSFGSFASEKQWLVEGEKLAESLTRDGKKFDNSHFYTAAYDSPFRFINRHNEIWFIAIE